MSDKLKTITLNVIKKNRVYFKCTHNGYDVKLRITPESEDLEPGVHDLLVLDESVRTRYGTDVIYTLQADIAEGGIVTLKPKLYNEYLTSRCRDLGGKWDADAKCWVFAKMVADEVENLEEQYNSDFIIVDIAANGGDISEHPAVTFAGYIIARASGRDSGATLGHGVSMLAGAIRSGGSIKNWAAQVKNRSVFRLEVARGALIHDESSYWSYETK